MDHEQDEDTVETLEGVLGVYYRTILVNRLLDGYGYDFVGDTSMSEDRRRYWLR